LTLTICKFKKVAMSRMGRARATAYPALLALLWLSSPLSSLRAQDRPPEVTSPDALADGGAAPSSSLPATDTAGLDAGTLRDASSPEPEPTPSVPLTTQSADPAPPLEAVDVTVHGSSKAQRTRESADAVTVLELDTAKRQAADLGEVLARVEGINVRRAGGLGSDMRFSLNGLTDDQIRFLHDDLPLELVGFSQGFANIPLLTLDRVVVYRGVVPIRFGADALGGAVNLVSAQPTRGAGVEGSYQVGSFGTHRGALSGYQVHKPSGLFTRLSLYVDAARNDYSVIAPVSAPSGAVTSEKVERFHDAYRAYGGALELGVVKKPWAERLVLRVSGLELRRELQTDLIMFGSFGEARYRQQNYAAQLRYHQPLTRALRLEAIAGYSYLSTRFIDDSMWIYDWRGERTGPRPSPGESSRQALDTTTLQHSTFARVLLTYKLGEGHKLELALSPTHALRTGRDNLRLEGSRDRFAADLQQLSVVSGLAYTANLLDDLLENAIFAKSYVYRTYADELAPNGTPIERDASITRFGAGDALRVRLTRSLYTKLSYELATRLPRPDEIFGNGLLIIANLQLKEETSHNGNLELTLRHDTERAGQLRASLNGFVRAIRNQVVLVPRYRDSRYDNVHSARAQGVESSAGWTSPGDYLAFDINLTYVDLRNTSSKGTFGRYEGDRVPNRPYLFTNASTRGMLHSLVRQGDELSLTWYMRYVHEFYRYWASDGDPSTKLTVPTQQTHALSLVYALVLDALELDTTVEVQNLADARVFDNYGAQRPGRAYYFKLTGRR
jgi:vitamin B12 transporter